MSTSLLNPPDLGLTGTRQAEMGSQDRDLAKPGHLAALFPAHGLRGTTCFCSSYLPFDAVSCSMSLVDQKLTTKKSYLT